MEACRIVYVDKSDDLEETLKSFGYSKRSGDASYTKDCIAIVPKKKWYWFCNLSKEYRDSRVENC